MIYMQYILKAVLLKLLTMDHLKYMINYHTEIEIIIMTSFIY